MINFTIKTKDGKKFLEESKDRNEIHQKNLSLITRYMIII